MNPKDLKMFRPKANKKEKAQPLEMPKIDTEHLILLMQKLEDLHGKRYSQLTYEEKKLVELSCHRIFVDSKGKRWNDKADAKFHTLTYSPWFKWFVGMVFDTPVQSMRVDTDRLYIIEDEPMIISNLEVSNVKPSQHPIADAITNWPNNQPVHLYKDPESKHPIGNAWFSSTSKQYSYAARPGFLKAEPAYKDAPVWLNSTPDDEITLKSFLNSLGEVTEDDYGKISFILEVNERITLMLARTKPDWVEFLEGKKVSTVALDDAEYFSEHFDMKPVIVNTKEEFLDSCMQNIYTILEV